jgi:protein phosphatase
MDGTARSVSAPDATRAPHPAPLPGLSPDALVVLVGASGCGKSSWATRRFEAHEVLSSDVFREMVSGDAADQGASNDAFRLLHLAARARLRRGLRTVVDATNLTARARRALLGLARAAGRPAVAVVFDVPLDRCLAQNGDRAGRRVPEDVVREHHRQLALARAALPGEGFSAVVTVTAADLDARYDAPMPNASTPLPS